MHAEAVAESAVLEDAAEDPGAFVQSGQAMTTGCRTFDRAPSGSSRVADLEVETVLDVAQLDDGTRRRRNA